jgi:hypothetical protein
MSVLANRTEMEAALGRALSRHIGHTTAAYDLDRILSILEFFQDRPSAYKEEIVGFLIDRGLSKDAHQGVSQEYLDGIVTFARSLGIIQQTSGRDLRLQKYSPTEQGRSLLAAQKVGNSDFTNFYVARVAFIADADSLMALLTYYHNRPERSLFDYYVTFFINIRSRRYAWLQRAFDEPLLFDRIARHLGWLSIPKRGTGEPKIEPFTTNTARHHSTPRKGWLTTFGMLDRDSDQLTSFGERAFQSLRQSGEYFWLGPPRGVQEALRISPTQSMSGPFEDEFGFTSQQAEASPEHNRAISGDVAELMTIAFPHAKLIHASQASLLLPIEFILYRSFTDGVRYDPIAVLDEVFQEHRDKIDRLSALKGRIGFYRVK